MLGFTLSKFSLLVLVVAIFGIVSFFTLHLTESLKSKALTDMLYSKSTIASEMMSSPSYCDALLVKIPEIVELSASKMYYLMRISAKTTLNGDKTYLIFSAANKNKPEQAVAASSSPTVARIVFYKRISGEYNEASGDDGIVLDPSARSTDPNFADAFYLVKEISDSGEIILYVFSCPVSPGVQSICRDALIAVGKKVHGDGKKFECGERQ